MKFIAENWVLILVCAVYLFQIIRVVHWQYRRLERLNRERGTYERDSVFPPAMPMWKFSLFILPGVPVVWGFIDLFLFDTLINVFIMTYKNDRKLKQK